MKNPNRTLLILLITFALSFLAFITAINSQTNYYTTGMGAWTLGFNWSPSSPGETIAAGDTVFVRHVISNSFTTEIKINGVLVIEATGIIIGSKKITIEAGGELINNGAIAINKEIDNYGNIYNNNWFGVKEMYIEGYLCNTGIISISDGESIDLYGGTIECGGLIIADEISVENDGVEIAYLQDINICKDNGGDPIIDYRSGVIDSTTVEICGLSLPVELSMYSVKLKDNNVRIDWSTASEINNDYFVVERSSDGYYFEEMAKVLGAGNSESIRYYDITDEFPFEGVSYYRLKQVDFDGKVTYFDIKMVDNKDGYVDEHGLTVYPNPIMEHSKFSIGLAGFGGNFVEIKIQDMSGFLIYSKEVEISQERELIELDTKIIQDSGMYVASVFSGNKWYQHKFLLMK